MDEVIVDLTGMASLNIGDGVRDHLRSIIAKSSKLICGLWSGLVSSAHTSVSFIIVPLVSLYIKGMTKLETSLSLFSRSG